MKNLVIVFGLTSVLVQGALAQSGSLSAQEMQTLTQQLKALSEKSDNPLAKKSMKLLEKMSSGSGELTASDRKELMEVLKASKTQMEERNKALDEMMGE